MPTLPSSRIAALLQPFYSGPGPDPTPELLEKLSLYLDLLLKWNARTNLTAIRDPEEMVERHFGESLFTARALLAREGPACQTLLDLGSGAGFPGVPIQLALPELRVTLAESQNKKAAFLREVVRSLGLKTKIWADRAENLPAGTVFDVVAMRAVDNPAAALAAGRRLLSPGGVMVRLGIPDGTTVDVTPIPGSDRTALQFYSSQS
jgi:16S rRNA (guanine527-N7)-methyltransferase